MDCLTADYDVSNTTVFKGAEMTKTKVKKKILSLNESTPAHKPSTEQLQGIAIYWLGW